MRPSNDLPCVYVCQQPVDFRKQINGLSVMVENTLLLNPFSEHLFVFFNRRRNSIKILYWERNGFCLWQKRLERDQFFLPSYKEDVISLTGQQLNWLLDGYDLSLMKPHEKLPYSSVI